MSTQRPDDTIPHQQETEAVIDQRLAQSGGLAPPNLTFFEDGGELYPCSGSAAVMGAANVRAYRWGGRIWLVGYINVAEDAISGDLDDLWSGNEALLTLAPEIGNALMNPGGNDVVIPTMKWDIAEFAPMAVYLTTAGDPQIYGDNPNPRSAAFSAGSYLAMNVSFAGAITI